MQLTWQQAHNISIIEYLETEGIFPVSKSSGNNEYHYHSPIRASDTNPSFHVNILKNKWHDKALGIGGDVIDLVAQHKNITRSKAVYLLADSGLYVGDYVPTYSKA